MSLQPRTPLDGWSVSVTENMSILLFISLTIFLSVILLFCGLIIGLLCRFRRYGIIFRRRRRAGSISKNSSDYQVRVTPPEKKKKKDQRGQESVDIYHDPDRMMTSACSEEFLSEFEKEICPPNWAIKHSSMQTIRQLRAQRHWS